MNSPVSNAPKTIEAHAREAVSCLICGVRLVDDEGVVLHTFTLLEYLDPRDGEWSSVEACENCRNAIHRAAVS